MHHYALTAEDLQARVLFKDNLILVVNKPAGIPVHPGPRKYPSLEDYFGALKFELPHAPWLAHRLDRDTSGCLILGRQKKALRRLGKLFESGDISKTYWAIVHGGPQEDEGLIDGWLEKVKTPQGWYMRVCGKKEAAQRAVTAWKVVKRAADFSFLELKPETGRTHQIRVHCQSLGCPVIGDWVYGPSAKEGATLPLLHLHARAIEIPLYEGQPPLVIEAPVSPHMAASIS
ncbi:MAG: RNA pseudouridine synthase [Alphaproteobacteria bacterium]|nr:RNA pseudouridine synthase [Alphaproteobacteria bacterium]